MGEGFVDRLVGILELDVFSGHSHRDTVGGIFEAANDVAPFIHRLLLAVDAQKFNHQGVEVFPLEHQGKLINR
ncbi:MAG: hypothetical protein BWY82_01248 [Verrucomicrobia bacterium ADurb.Bin474]|nr:MAG: hypothetical protein BWY82_01248 [Verrucomicrobia bacterium ADurb.Bin474]